MTILPTLEILDLLEINETGWGPRTPEATDGIVDGVPFQQYNKADRVGRVADWLGGDRFYRRGNERYFFFFTLQNVCLVITTSVFTVRLPTLEANSITYMDLTRVASNR